MDGIEIIKENEMESTLTQIQEHLRSGGKVMVCTYTKATIYDFRHVNMFKANKSGLFVQRGKNWDCISYCGIKFSKLN